LIKQVYASYKYRRDLAQAAKISGLLGRSRPLKREEAEAAMVRSFLLPLWALRYMNSMSVSN
jgi:hypothetical protein